MSEAKADRKPRTSLPTPRNNQPKDKNLTSDTEAIIDRLKQEGDLFRNSGTNSLKSVKLQLEKFSSVFETIALSSEKQRQIMESFHKLQLENLEETRRQKQFEKIRPVESESKGGKKTKQEKIETALPKDHHLLQSLVGWSRTQLAATVAGLAGVFLRGGMLKSILLAASVPIAAVVGKNIEGWVGDWTGDGETARLFGDAANLGSLGLLVGAAFGKKMGLIGGAAGLAYSFGDDLVDAIGLDGNKMIAGMKLDTLVSLALGISSAAAISGLTSKGTVEGLKSLTLKSAALIGAKNALKLSLVGAIASLAYAYSDEAAEWITGKSVDGDPMTALLSDVGQWTAMGLSMGAMFGPAGMLVGAIAGLSVGLFKGAMSWIEKTTTDTAESLAAEADKKLKEAQAGIKPAETLGDAAASAAEAMRRTDGQKPSPLSLERKVEATPDERARIESLSRDIEAEQRLQFDPNDAESVRGLLVSVLNRDEELKRLFEEAEKTYDENASAKAMDVLLQKYPEFSRVQDFEMLNDTLWQALNNALGHWTENVTTALSAVEVDDQAMTKKLEEARKRLSSKPIHVPSLEPVKPTNNELPRIEIPKIDLGPFDLEPKPSKLDTTGMNMIIEDALSTAGNAPVQYIDKSSNVYAPSVTQGGSSSTTHTTFIGGASTGLSGNRLLPSF